MASMSADEFARLEKSIQFYEWALANYNDFIRTERKPRTKVNLQKRLAALKEEAQHARVAKVHAE